MPVTIVEAEPVIGDAHHRLFQQASRIAHRLREGAAQISGEIEIAVIGEAVFETMAALGYARRSERSVMAHSTASGVMQNAAGMR
jgi:hypothetical protein